MGRKLSNKYIRKMAVELEKLTNDPTVKEALYGWHFDYAYPGYYEWYHPARPDGALAATPEHDLPRTISTQWTSYSGGMEVGPDVPFDWVGDDPKLDAAIYLHRLTPYLMLVVSQGFGGQKFGLTNRKARRLFKRSQRNITTRQRRRMPQSDFALPIKDQSPKFRATHPKFAGAYPMQDRSHGANARSRAIQMLNAGYLSLKEARTIFARTSRKWGFQDKDIVKIDGRWKSVPAGEERRAAANKAPRKGRIKRASKMAAFKKQKKGWVYAMRWGELEELPGYRSASIPWLGITKIQGKWALYHQPSGLWLGNFPTLTNASAAALLVSKQVPFKVAMFPDQWTSAQVDAVRRVVQQKRFQMNRST